MQHDLVSLKSRRSALKFVYDSITNEAFTDNERDIIDKHIRECDAEIMEKELAIAHHADFVQTTISKCTTDMATRTQTLNKVFSEDIMRDHQSMMAYFSSHHKFLSSVLNDESDGGGSELDDRA